MLTSPLRVLLAPQFVLLSPQLTVFSLAGEEGLLHSSVRTALFLQRQARSALLFLLLSEAVLDTHGGQQGEWRRPQTTEVAYVKDMVGLPDNLHLARTQTPILTTPPATTGHNGA